MKKMSLCFLLAVIFTGCRFPFTETVTGSGNLMTEDRNPAGFSAISSNAAIDIVLAPSNRFYVRVSGDDNLLKYIVIKKNGSTLNVSFKPNIHLRNNQRLRVEIGMPELRRVSASGSGNISGTGVFKCAGKMELSTSASGSIDLEIDCPTVESKISGSGAITVGGKCRKSIARISGSGSFLAKSLLAEEADVVVSGSGNASVFASILLNAKVTGSGELTYSGKPQTIRRRITGSGIIKPE